jgi:hypothetical protein
MEYPSFGIWVYHPPTKYSTVPSSMIERISTGITVFEDKGWYLLSYSSSYKH